MKPPKIQRWIDLLAALLRHRYPVTLDQLIPEVPWAVRHVLQYGADVTVLEPAEVREAVVRRLGTMAEG